MYQVFEAEKLGSWLPFPTLPTPELEEILTRLLVARRLWRGYLRTLFLLEVGELECERGQDRRRSMNFLSGMFQVLGTEKLGSWRPFPTLPTAELVEFLTRLLVARRSRRGPAPGRPWLTAHDRNLRSPPDRVRFPQSYGREYAFLPTSKGAPDALIAGCCRPGAPDWPENNLCNRIPKAVGR